MYHVTMRVQFSATVLQYAIHIVMYFICRRLIKAIPHVTMEDLLRVGKKYIAPVFDPKCSKVAICCHPTKVEEITKDFKE